MILADSLADILVLAAAAMLAALTFIDARTMILPDRLVFLYGLLGIAFHVATHFAFLTPLNLLLGAVTGGGMLAIVRWAGSHHYGQEAMGLGDVKLLIAGGVWLGAMGAVWAITLGAGLTVLFAFAYATVARIQSGKFPDLQRLEVPAGPGFCVALFILMLCMINGVTL
ncbi:MAG: A24 family peptidase [Pseudomonadota bacterium]